MSSKLIYSIALLFSLLLPGVAAIGAEPDLDMAQKLIGAGKAGEAFKLLEPFDFDKSGDIKFDYIYGIAALESGRPDKATLALERVLATDPNFSGARMDMARGYFMIGDFVRAKTEFGTVLSQNPPPLAKQVVEKYLRAIEEREKSQKQQVKGYVEATYGYDSNITTVTGDFMGGVMSAYAIPGVQATGNSIQRSGSFTSMGGGFDIAHTVEEGISLYAGLDGKSKVFAQAEPFNTDTVDGKFGVNVSSGSNMYKLGYQTQYFYQNGDTPITNNTKAWADRTSYSYLAEWKRMVGSSDLFGVGAQLGGTRTPYTTTSDVDQNSVTLSWLHLFGGQGKPILFSSFTSSRDNALRKLANGSDVSKESMGVRFFGQVSLNETLDIFSGLGYQEKDDKAEFARSTVVAIGKDSTADISIGANWRFMDSWTLKPQVSYSKNRSNIDLYVYDRTEASVTVRYDFK